MSHGTSRRSTTHIGSLIWSPGLRPFIGSWQDGKVIDNSVATGGAGA